MNVCIAGSSELTPDYIFVSNLKDPTKSNDDVYMDFDMILNDIVDTVLMHRKEDDISFVTRGNNSGVDAIVKIWADENDVDVIETEADERLGENANVVRDIEMIKNSDICILFPIKYENTKKNDLDRIIDLASDLDKNVLIFNMEKYS